MSSSHSLFNFSHMFAANDIEDRPSSSRPVSHHSSDCSTSHSGRSDGFDRSSSTNDDSSWSRESSPAFEIIMDPDLSYRKEAGWQSQEASGALSVAPSPNHNAASQPQVLPSSSEVASYEDSNMDDELWNELMGLSDTEMTEPQTGNAASALDSGNTGLDDDEEDEMLAKLTASLDKELEEEEMLAKMTASLDKELEEMKGAQQSTAEMEAAESARSKALLEEQLRVAAEKAALARQFDYLHESPRSKSKKKSKAAAIRRVIRRPSLTPRLNGVDKGLEFKRWRRATTRIAWRKAAREQRAPEPIAAIPGTIVEIPENNADEQTPSAAGTSTQSTQELPRLYHQANRIDWRPLWDRVTLTTNLDTQTCLQSLGLDPVRGDELSNKLKEYLRVPGNSVSLSRQDIYSNRGKQIITKLAHNLLCDQLWGQTYFNQPHVGSGYSNVRFEIDSTWILIEFSKLLYQIVKLEERRTKSRLRSQQKKDAKNAVKHPVARGFVSAPVDHGNAPPCDLRQKAVSQPAPAQHQAASTFVPSMDLLAALHLAFLERLTHSESVCLRKSLPSIKSQAPLLLGLLATVTHHPAAFIKLLCPCQSPRLSSTRRFTDSKKRLCLKQLCIIQSLRLVKLLRRCKSPASNKSRVL
ncbi:hypothetical protein VMCG_00591 [Cytospora schulzeri]|uniref:Uncharacterized protein n=1 Tax=Cytospora schulzeri TaxID=448051 RepID=A0A423X954_9PEZI|nr:hypothetical protein VMCG_00591 [Valsa malicola]